MQNLQPQLIKTVGEVEALMVRIAKEKADVVQPKAAAVAVDEAAAQAKVQLNPPNALFMTAYFSAMLLCELWVTKVKWTCADRQSMLHCNSINWRSRSDGCIFCFCTALA